LKRKISQSFTDRDLLLRIAKCKPTMQAAGENTFLLHGTK